MSNGNLSNVDALLERMEENNQSYVCHQDIGKVSIHDDCKKLAAIVREWREMLVTDPTIDSETTSFYLAKANEIAGGD